MSDQPSRPPSALFKAASEPDLTALPHNPHPSPRSPSQLPSPPPLILPPPSPIPSISPRSSPRIPPSSSPLPFVSNTSFDAAVSFSEYVASELAADQSLGVSFVPAAPPAPELDALSDLHLSAPPSPERSPVPQPARDMSELGAGSAPDMPGAGVGIEGLEDRRCRPMLPELPFADALSQQQSEQPVFQNGGMGRYGKLACIQLNEKGDVEERQLTRAEILQEARETQSGKFQPSPKAIGRWLSSTSAAQSPSPELREFTNLLEPGTVASRKATQKALRDYLRNSLQARDIRQVDPAFVAKPALWVRHSALVVSLEGLRSIILHNKMFLFDPTNERTRQSVFIVKQSILSKPDVENPQPFEFRALEGILIFLAMGLEREFATLKPEIETYLHQLPNQLTTQMLEELRRNKQQLHDFNSRASNVKTILENLLDEDEEMANMYLTEKYFSHRYGGRSSVDHNEVETMLEAYLQVIDEHVNQSTLLNDAIDDTEDLVMIHLDTLRNQLLSVELGLSVVSMTFGVGGIVSGMFGMNIQIPMFEATASKYWFWVVVSTIVVMVMTVCLGVLIVLRRRGLYSFY